MTEGEPVDVVETVTVTLTDPVLEGHEETEFEAERVLEMVTVTDTVEEVDEVVLAVSDETLDTVTAFVAVTERVEMTEEDGDVDDDEEGHPLDDAELVELYEFVE